MVKWLKKLFEFYINSSLHVAFAVVAFMYVTAKEFDFSISKNLLFFVFFGSISGYNFVKYAGVAKLHHRSLANWLKFIQVFSLICFLFFILFGWQISRTTLLVSGLFGLLTLFYALPIFPNQKNLRSLAGIKIFIIALVWSGVTVVIPVYDAGIVINAAVWLEFSQRLLLVLVLMLPFEIRDLRYDDSLLKTLPQALGVAETKKVGIGILVFSMVLEVLQNSEAVFLLSYFLISVVSALLVYKSTVDQSKYYASFWVEAVPILWFFLIIFLHQWL